MALSKNHKDIYNAYGPTKPIPGFDDYYVTPAGRIISARHNQLRELQLKMCNGYHVVDLMKAAASQRLYVHKVVALCWVKNMKGYSNVRHLDNKRINNDYRNLKWSDRVECYIHGNTGKWQKPGDTAWDRHWRISNNGKMV